MPEVKTGGSVIVECCECGLQHIWIFKIIRGKNTQDDKVEFEVFRNKESKKIS